MGAALEQTIAALEKERSIEFVMRPTYVDAASCTIVAFLQDRHNKQVLAATAFDVTAGDGPEP